MDTGTGTPARAPDSAPPEISEPPAGNPARLIYHAQQLDREPGTRAPGSREPISPEHWQKIGTGPALEAARESAPPRGEKAT